MFCGYRQFTGRNYLFDRDSILSGRNINDRCVDFVSVSTIWIDIDFVLKQPRFNVQNTYPMEMDPLILILYHQT